MIVLWILLGIAAFLILLLISSIHIRIRWEDKLKITLRVWFISLNVLSLAERFGKGQKKKKKEKPKKETKVAPKPKEKKKRSLSDVLGLIRFLTRLLTQLLADFFRRLRIKIYRLQLSVASDSPDQTALLYGAACPAVYQLCEIARRYVHCDLDYDRIQVVSDFTSNRIRGKVDVRFSFRFWDLLAIAAKLFMFLQELKNDKGDS